MRAIHLIGLMLAAWLLSMACRAAELTDADLRRMRAEKRVALVIGNATYRNFAALENPLNDARGVADALRTAGFDVTLELDATRDSLLSAVNAFASLMQSADVALFYFAGHAAQVNWRNFIVPISAELDAEKLTAGDMTNGVANETLDLNEVLQRMAGNVNRLNIVILDACRDNPFTTEAVKISRSLSRTAGKTLPVAAGLAQTSAPAGTFLAYSTAPGQVASDGEGQNSPYSAALITALKAPGLRLEDVFKQVRNSVATSTRNEQIPWDNSSVFRDFYFRIPESAAAAARRKGELNTTFVSP
jgi:uncharacterized caspase-like protein